MNYLITANEKRINQNVVNITLKNKPDWIHPCPSKSVGRDNLFSFRNELSRINSEN